MCPGNVYSPNDTWPEGSRTPKVLPPPELSVHALCDVEIEAVHEIGKLDLGIGEDNVVVAAHETKGVQPDLKLFGGAAQAVQEDSVDEYRRPHEEVPLRAPPGHMTRRAGKKVSWCRQSPRSLDDLQPPRRADPTAPSGQGKSKCAATRTGRSQVSPLQRPTRILPRNGDEI